MAYKNPKTMLALRIIGYTAKTLSIFLFCFLLYCCFFNYSEGSDYQPIPYSEPNWCCVYGGETFLDPNLCTCFDIDPNFDMEVSQTTVNVYIDEIVEMNDSNNESGCFITSLKRTMDNDSTDWLVYDAPTLNPWDMTTRRTGSFIGWLNFYIWRLSFLLS